MIVTRNSPYRGSPNRNSPYRGSPYRQSPRKFLNETVMEPEVQRALARELYIEETVNVVNPTSSGSPGKVKPG
jgi:hypothetical protein